MSVSGFWSQATVIWAEKQRGINIKVNIIARIVRKDCEIKWLAQGDLSNEFEERFSKKTLRFRSGPTVVKVRSCVLRIVVKD
jgi:hypothetical protein